jgi:hypothetical protein
MSNGTLVTVREIFSGRSEGTFGNEEIREMVGGKTLILQHLSESQLITFCFTVIINAVGYTTAFKVQRDLAKTFDP